MTSKEAILELICEAKSPNCNDKRISFLRRIIEEDLEILEILKKVFNYKSVQKFVENMTKDEFFKVKEWLENDRN